VSHSLRMNLGVVGERMTGFNVRDARSEAY
jgi:hypothetical protein